MLCVIVNLLSLNAFCTLSLEKCIKKKRNRPTDCPISMYFASTTRLLYQNGIAIHDELANSFVGWCGQRRKKISPKIAQCSSEYQLVFAFTVY